jgi:hypothetical protein
MVLSYFCFYKGETAHYFKQIQQIHFMFLMIKITVLHLMFVEFKLKHIFLFLIIVLNKEYYYYFKLRFLLL